MKPGWKLVLAGLLAGAVHAPAERINQEGRILGPLPVVTNSVLFNTPQAGAVVEAMQIFPVSHAWNENISNRPLLTNSAAMISQINSDLSLSHQHLVVFFEMNFVLVPDTQALVSIAFDLPPEFYAGESDPGPYPIPSNMPIEGWPHETGSLTLSQWQQSGVLTDRHAIVAQPGTGLLWEMWRAKLTNGLWHAASGAKWDMNTNGLREVDLTSADAAGLPMFGGLVRYDECQRGMVEHACRIVVATTRAEHIYPATHKTGSDTTASRPAMGQRVRLKSDYVIPDAWTVPEKAVLKGLKKYGALVSDNGNFFSISAVPDDRWAGNEFDHLTTVSITNFEVVQTTGENESPRSPGAPVANAGADQFLALGATASLPGFVSFSGAPPVVQWTNYSGPTNMTFGNATQTNTTANFTAPGIYTLRLSASNGVHAVAYDAVVITVTQAINVAIAHLGTNVSLTWAGGAPPYVLEKANVLASNSWSVALSTNSQSALVPISGSNGFFRIRGQAF